MCSAFACITSSDDPYILVSELDPSDILAISKLPWLTPQDHGCHFKYPIIRRQDQNTELTKSKQEHAYRQLRDFLAQGTCSSMYSWICAQWYSCDYIFSMSSYVDSSTKGNCIKHKSVSYVTSNMLYYIQTLSSYMFVFAEGLALETTKLCQILQVVQNSPRLEDMDFNSIPQEDYVSSERLKVSEPRVAPKSRHEMIRIYSELRSQMCAIY